MKKPTAKIVMYAALAVIVLLVAIQLVPYGKKQDNPPIIKEPAWSLQATRVLAKRACFDCHSNETAWPWYSRVAPVSWLIQWDVNKGRKVLNFSEWQDGMRKGENPKKIKEELVEGEMPPFQYTLIHGVARLTKEEQQQLAVGLTATALQAKR
jgi:mono/diheme cytochrome c family protein